MQSTQKLEHWIAREIASREEAEKLLEAKSLELFLKNQELQCSSTILRNHIELISTIMDAVPHIVLTCNEDFTIEMANSASAKLLGYPPEHLGGRHLSEILPDCETYRYELEKDSFLVTEATARRNDGSSFDAELCGRRTHVNARPLVVIVVSDASLRKVAEQVREDVSKQLSEARRLEAIGTLASGIAHELNTPIQFIGDNVKFVGLSLNKIHASYKKYDELKCECEAAGLSHEKVAEVNAFNADIELPSLVTEIMAAIRETLEGIRQVRDIVLLMKEFTHPGTSQPEPADINLVIQSAITICRSRHKNVVTLETDFAPNLPQLTCRRGQIQQVLVNMIVNAVEAIEEQGVPNGLLRIATRRTEAGIRIEVSDNGPGIPSALGEKIFDPFFTTKQVGKGTGQGLALAKDFIVTQHGGKLLLESKPSFATTFVIELPLAPPATSQPEPFAQYAQA
jgi:two-component system, NtrC family, sensor kinase